MNQAHSVAGDVVLVKRAWKRKLEAVPCADELCRILEDSIWRFVGCDYDQ